VGTNIRSHNVEWKLYLFLCSCSDFPCSTLRTEENRNELKVACCIDVFREERVLEKSITEHEMNSANFKYVDFFLVVYCRNYVIFYAVNIARLDNPTVTLPSF
jgi:hypothetical protein